jgi:excisionase family DNA binding protein
MADTYLLRAKEAAAYLEIGTNTLYRLASDGTIPAARIGALWRLRCANLEN